jgi:hypothetical protein
MPKIDAMLQRIFPARRPEPAPTDAKNPTETVPAATGKVAPATPSDSLELTKTLPQTAPNLTAEEKVLIGKGLLPEVYGELKAVMEEDGVDAAKKAYRKGKDGPFDPSFGDPTHMLWLAKKLDGNAEWQRLAKDVQPGDILVETYNKPEDMISQLTGGPFVHARLCVSANPPEFIEAVGITGNSQDATNNTVRWSPMPFSEGMSVRVIRPTENVSEPQKSRAIKEAIDYAKDQLGKPYDYSYTNVNQGDGLTDAFYCSELAYLAYASPEGANFNIPIDKSAERDQLIVALNDLVTALNPRDKEALMDVAMKLFTRNPKPSGTEMVAFLVDNVMTKCEATEKITATPEDRERLKKTIQSLMEGQAFPSLHQAINEFNADDAAGKYDAPIIGWGQEQKNRLDIGVGLAKDLGHLIGTSGLNYQESIKTAWDVTHALLPHSEVLMSFLYGPQDSRTQMAGKVLDSLDWLKQNVPDLPVIGDLGLGNLPERAKPTLKRDFVSPTDLAWADLPQRDYNVKSTFPIDQQGYEKFVTSQANG